MWPSEEWASRIYDWSNVGLLVGLVIGVISTCLVVWMGNVKEAYFKNQIAVTKQDTALANERAAKAMESATLAENKNLILESQLLTLRKQTEARRLTGEQKIKLANLLSNENGGVAIVSPMADGEAFDFADDFDSALQAAHWQTGRIKNHITSRFGVSLLTVEGTALPSTKKLSDALTSIGITHDVIILKTNDSTINTIVPAFQAGYLYLVINHKPYPTLKNAPLHSP